MGTRVKLNRNRYGTSKPEELKTNASTPKRNVAKIVENDYSPIFIPCTQESQDNMDVLWDWNSPVSNIKRTQKPKRLLMKQKPQSPQLKIKKMPETQQTTAFEKIKEELQEFRNEISCLDSNLINNNNDSSDKDINPHNSPKFDDFFDESFDEVMLMASQQIEEKIESKQIDLKCSNVTVIINNTKNSPRLKKSLSYDDIGESPMRRPNLRFSNESFKLHQSIPEFPLAINDSLDSAFEGFDDSYIEATMANIPVTTPLQVTTTKSPTRKFKMKSLSFDDCLEHSNQKTINETIELKRQAALARLQAKKTSMPLTQTTNSIQCSPEEIERKRQEALAKLEAKKKEELIEKNRREALRRLQLNRKKKGQNW